ncbi:type III secretion system inner membrane ring lipoprotein SctJ [Duganella vulcania]|uniref:Lipoprotein n=1 Tax=Duganella vulcania TaxID=2692166 RepID=A0A845GZG7_9BURK|nr:type III secretion inner membrane ring lipoprotein SctJ [Duganella vulcania]MYM98638.1 EscJ/YscJ/HrcJ family type III secretion inner membrane ring protein [Duganella vulcania]
MKLLRLVLNVLLPLALSALLSGCGNRANLQVGLNDADANEIVTLLTRYGIEAQKVATKDGVTLTVNADDIARATTAMQAAGLPRRALSDLGQIFKKDSMISTPLEERARYIHGLSAELESTLQQFDNVISARVHVVLPERIAPGEPVQPSSAAVFIKYHDTVDEDTLIPRIRQLVASSIPGLAGESGRAKVSVVMAASVYTVPVIEWSNVGPFRVQAGSAMALSMTLLGLALLMALMLIGLLFALCRYHPGLAAWIKSHFGKPPAFSAGNTTEQEPA